MPYGSASALAEFILQEIAQHGPMSFARYMELALYHPNWGYYRRERDPFGIHGDFFTAEQLAPFADLLRTFVEKAAPSLSDPSACQVVELGAGRRELKNAFGQFRYRGLDWDNGERPEAVSGVVIANEFFDALPVCILRREQVGWVELTVSAAAEGLRFAEAASSSILEMYAQRYGADTPPGGILEMNASLEYWIAFVGGFLVEGCVLVIDYGYSDRELPRLADGTLMSYRKHVATPDVLIDPGERDITAHVNFTELIRVAERYGFTVRSDSTFREWALSLWSSEELEAQWATHDQHWRMQWKQLVFGMGETFRVVVLGKDQNGSSRKTNAPETSGAESTI